MTIQELYERVDGSYEQAVRVMRFDKLIDRYVRRFEESDHLSGLQAAVENMDAVSIFDSAHALKGICSNLGFNRLAAEVSVLAEEFRPGSARQLSDEQVREKLRNVEELYLKTVDVIRTYQRNE